ncbi:MAG: hypothetical protein MJ248_01850 [Bacilli bacterium]|nr:hypothetical protein [Bacilli bacterium]
MKNKWITLSTLPILVLTGCKATSGLSNGLKKAMLGEPVKENVTQPANYNTFLNKVNNFSAKFTEATLKDKNNTSNYAVSPVSVFVALAMTVESSDGETRQEILDALDLTYEELTNNIQYFVNSMNVDFTHRNSFGKLETHGGIKLTNSIWFQKGSSIKEKLIKVLSELYYSYSFQVDFEKENKKANSLIRDFIKRQTNGLIDQDLELNVATLVVLLNTLYFKDTWDERGKDLSFTSKEYEFTMEDLSTKSIKLLKGYSCSGKVVKEDKYRSFYTRTNSGAKLTFVVPNAGYSLSEVFTKETITECMARKYITVDEEKKEMYFTDCCFPEFEASYNDSLKNVLKEGFGIEKAFDKKKADFSNTSDWPLFVNDIRHVTKLNVNKTGVEGAAITVVSMDIATSTGPEYEYVYDTFVVDRSFGYVLSCGGPLFTGVVQTI